MFSKFPSRYTFIGAVLFVTVFSIVFIFLTNSVNVLYQSYDCTTRGACFMKLLQNLGVGDTQDDFNKTSNLWNNDSHQSQNLTSPATSLQGLRISNSSTNASISLNNSSTNTSDNLSNSSTNTSKRLTIQNFNQSLDVTTMTFDHSLVVRCKNSPFIFCPTETVKQGLDNYTYHVAILRHPDWLRVDFSKCGFKCHSDGAVVTERTDVVLVYGVNLNDDFKPPRRLKHQLFGLSMWESPVHTHSGSISSPDSIWRYMFNLTITYNLDSEIFVPYSKIRFNPQPINHRPNYYEIAKKKSKTAVWFVSNCHAQSQRQKYVKEMQKYIDVDIFGGCGSPCKVKNASCVQQPFEYKFYLSFENSFCKDYLTEKFMRWFRRGEYMIPVARGAADYDKYFPEFTFINAAHFKTAKDLALHLKNLSADLVTYSKYLEYKDLYESTDFGIGSNGCVLCEFLHTQRVNKVYDLYNWWNVRNCSNPNDV